MKKLLVTAIGAAVAFGAFADAVRFESSAAGTVTALSQLPGGTSLWSEPEGATNTYAIGAAGTVSAPLSIASSGAQPTQALDIKTTFGKPLSLNAVSGGAATNINDGLYFDSLVKFTVCEDAPADTYTGAKIIMWLQEKQDASGNATGTNLIVRAGYLSGGDTVAATPTNYVCALPNGFNADAWHRVTIKAIADITTTRRGVPGFAIYLDQNGDTATSDINAGTANMWDDSFPDSELTEAASLLNDSRALFPSLDVTSGNKATLTSASFDGTGSITDLIFTDNGPDFAKDMASNKARIQIGDDVEEFTTLNEAIAALNAKKAASLTTVTLALEKGMDLDGSPIAINNIDENIEVVIDLNGCGITNSVGATLTIQSPVTIIDSSVAKTGEIVTTGVGDDDCAILVNGSGNLALAAGTIVGYMVKDGDDAAIIVSGGTINQDTGYELAEGKVAVDSSRGEGFYDIVDKPNTWAGLLGEAVDGAYTIDDAKDVLALQNGVLAGLATAGETFKQTANIDMTDVADFYGIGWFNSSTSFASVPTGVASDGKTDLPFAGTYDGQGYTISNVTIVKHSYAGVFNNVSGTVRNLTVQDIGLSGTCTEWGCAIVGNAGNGSLLENLTAVTSSGFNWGNSANHNVAGIVVRPIGTATIRGCVNNANISATAKRVGGIASFVGSGSTGTVFDSCTNNAALVSSNGTRGVGGILGCAEGNTTDTATIIRNCVDFGSETAQAEGGYAGAIVGSNWNGSYTYTDDGGNTFKASTVDCGYVKNVVFGRAYAVESTINNEAFLTTVKAADIAKGGTYTLLTDIAASETPVITLDDENETIAFNLNGHTFAGTIASSHDGVEAVADTVDGVITYTATITDGWAYRLGNPVDGAYVINDAAELLSFKEGVAKLGTSGKTFKLGGNIDATDLGYFDGIGAYGTANSGLSNCTFDGAGYTISNVKFSNGKYRAFFGRVDNSTIQNLTINVADIAQHSDPTAEHGYSAFAGNLVNSTVKSCRATGTLGTTAKPTMHTCGGFAVKTDGGALFVDCTNEINMVCSLNDNPKIGGIVGLVQGSTASSVSNCWNFGNLTITANGVKAAGNGAGGLVGYAQCALTIYGGGNTGTITWSKTTAGDSANIAVKTGTIIAMQNSSTATISGGTVAQADAASVGAIANITGLSFATVSGNVATFVDALAAGNIYKVMASGATATFEFAEAGTIAFDTALASPQYAITATGDLEVTSATEGTVTTFTAAVPAPSGLDPATNTPVEIEAASEAAATNAVTLVTPTGVDAAAYKNLFDFTVKEVVAGEKYEVSIAGIKEEVQEAVSKAAVDVLTSDKATTVDVPAGLCYKVTTYTALGGDAVETKSGTSDGKGVSVSKPGTTQGFIKVELATKPLN